MDTIKDLLNQGKSLLESVLPKLKGELDPLKGELDPIWNEGKLVLQKVKEEYLPVLENIIKNIMKSSNIDVREVQLLSLKELLGAAKANIVKNANGIAAYKLQKEDSFFVYLANCKDGELLDEEVNKYVIIKSAGLAPDVVNLFSESDIVIIK